jgi:hypothetical protein
MPFGKHKGKSLEDIPASYLCWVLRECESAERWLKEAIIDDLRGRGVSANCWAGGRGQEPSSATSAGGLVSWEPVVAKWYREMTLTFHPDRGGSHEAMVAVSQAHDRLRVLLKEMATT